MPRQFHYAISGALCPMRARGPDRDRWQVAKLQVSRPTRQPGNEPSQGGSAGSNPVGATTEDQYNTAVDQQERRSAAVLCVRRRPVRSLLHPGIVRRVGVHGRATVIDGFGAQFVVPGFVAVDLAQPVLGAVFGQPRRGIGGPDVDRVP